MADPTTTPFRTSWSVTLPGSAGLVTTTIDRVIARCDEHVLTLDLEGKAISSVELGAGAGEGTWLASLPTGVVATDTRRGPRRTSEIVLIAKNKIAAKLTTGCLAGNHGICALGEELYCLGIDPAAGSVLRSFCTDGTRVIDTVRAGRDLLPAGDRLIVLDSFAEPGLVMLDSRGAQLNTLESIPAQDLALADGRALAALRTANAPERTMRAYDLATGQSIWSHAGHGPSVGLDRELAVHLVLHDGKLVPVARHCVSGVEVWRADVGVGDEPGTFRFAAGHVLFTHGTGTTVYRRDTGTFEAELTGIYALAVRQHRVFFGGSAKLACVDVT